MPILLRRCKSSNKFPPSNDEPKENSLIERSILGWAFNHQFKSGGPFYPSDHPEHRIRGVVFPFRQLGSQIWGVILPFRSPRASNFGGRFTLPTTPSIKFWGSFYPSDHPEHRIWGGRFTLPTTPSIEFGGHFRLSGSSEVKFGGHSCIIDLPDTQIWAHSCIIDLSDTLILGSFLHHRPVRASNLGVKIRGSKRGGVRFFSFFKNFFPITFPPTKKLRACAAQSFHFF